MQTLPTPSKPETRTHRRATAILLALACGILVVPTALAGGPPECKDGEDNDGDGLVDTSDPDCSEPGAKTESGSSGGGGEPTRGNQCSDGTDNDGDGFADFADLGCFYNIDTETMDGRPGTCPYLGLLCAAWEIATWAVWVAVSLAGQVQDGL